jgi:hypothetical protein
MTSRSTTLIFTALLLLASMAFAAAPAPNDAPVTPALMTSVAPAEASAPCNPLLAKLGISPLNSAKNDVTSAYPACGNCSDLPCRGKAIYDICGGTIRQPKKCRTADYVCLEDPDRPKCVCVDWGIP